MSVEWGIAMTMFCVVLCVLAYLYTRIPLFAVMVGGLIVAGIVGLQVS